MEGVWYMVGSCGDQKNTNPELSTEEALMAASPLIALAGLLLFTCIFMCCRKPQPYPPPAWRPADV